MRILAIFVLMTLFAGRELVEIPILHLPLTGLLNHRGFIDDLDRELARAQGENEPGALLYMDLDGFKAVNDNLGHHAGDALLREVGATLRSQLRTSDRSAPLGGDEFVVYMPCADAVRAAAARDRMYRVKSLRRAPGLSARAAAERAPFSSLRPRPAPAWTR